MGKYNLGELVWKIEADAKEFEKNMSNAQKGIASLGQGATNAGKNLSKRLTLPLLALGAVSLKNASDFEKQRVAFGTLLKDVDKGNQLFATLQKFSAETPLALGDITSSSERLLAVGVGMEDQITVLRQLGDLALGNSDKLGRLTNAYSKLKTKGRASLEELNLFTDAGIPLMDTLAQTMGVTTQEVFKLVSAGKVGMPEVQVAMDSLTGAGGRFNNAMKNASETASGKFSTSLDNLKIASADLGNIMLPVAKDILDSITRMAKGFSSLDQGTKETIVKIALAASTIGPLLLVVGKSITAFGTAKQAIGLFNGAMGKIPMNAKLAAGGIALVLTAVLAISRAMEKAEIKEYNEQLKQVNILLGQYVTSISELESFISQGMGLEKVNKEIDEIIANTGKFTTRVNKAGKEIRQYSVTLDRNGNVSGVWGTGIKDQIKNLEDFSTAINQSVTDSDKAILEKEKQIAAELEYLKKKKASLFLYANEHDLSEQQTEDLIRNNQELTDSASRFNNLRERLVELLAVRKGLIKNQDIYSNGIEKELGLFKEIESGLDIITNRVSFFGVTSKENSKGVDVIAEKIALFNTLLEKAANDGLPNTSDAVEYLKQQLKLLDAGIDVVIVGLTKSEKVMSNLVKSANGLQIATDALKGLQDISAVISQREIKQKEDEIKAIDKKIDKLKELDAKGRTSYQQQLEDLQNALSIARLEARTTEEINLKHAINVLQIEKDLNDKKDALTKESALLQYEADKNAWAAGILNIQLNAALGVMRAWGTLPVPAAIAATVAIGAAQLTNTALAVASKPKTPQFAEGVYSIPMDTEAFLHAGETVVPKTFTESIDAGEAALVNPKAITKGGQMQPINVYLGNSLVYSGMHDASVNRDFLIDKGALV